ncbi:pigment-dispersing hormone peptides [Belonocnema kinseyi]|uniref:pigment-dispersing hormone peptides n=1 Tax=Belonocnema kinseyi TaxID=2817044 RepID=UPI00143DA023|nr:pigment-dispersing hormone peptides [Belonocnema kinseyi]XP_033218941.1 pigment-dispersing hormone peptides [Belonocnema kinseyi]
MWIFTRHILAAITVLGITVSCVASSIDEVPANIMMSNFPYGRGVDNDLQFGRILLLPQRSCHLKRNSELINSLLGLPKNMNNAGKKK